MKQLFRGKYLMVLIASCGLAGAVLGLLVNVSGLFFTPIAEDLGVGRGSVSLTLTICNLVFALGGMVCPRLVKSKNFKLMLLISMIVFAGSTALLAAAPNLITLYILNGLRGFAAGVCGMVLITIVINNWFLESTSLVTSIAMAFSGLAGAVFSPILSSIITSAGWRVGYLVDAGLIALFELPAILLPIGFFPKDAGAEPYGKAAGAGKSAENAEDAAPSRFPITLMVLLTAYAILASYVASYPPHFPGIADSYGFSAAVGSTLLSICMVANSGGKILFGALADKFGAKKIIMLFSLLIGAGALLLMIFHVPGLMYEAAALFGLCYAIANVGTVTATRELAGRKGYNSVYPTVSMIATVANAFGSSLVGFMYDAAGNYNGGLILAAVLTVIMMGLIFSCYVFKKKMP